MNHTASGLSSYLKCCCLKWWLQLTIISLSMYQPVVQFIQCKNDDECWTNNLKAKYISNGIKREACDQMWLINSFRWLVDLSCSCCLRDRRRQKALKAAMFCLLLLTHCGLKGVRYISMEQSCAAVDLLQMFALRRAERQTLPLLTGLQELMGSGIVGYLHQFPLGRRGRGERRAGLFFPHLLSIGWQFPLALIYTYMIMKWNV